MAVLVVGHGGIGVDLVVVCVLPVCDGTHLASVPYPYIAVEVGGREVVLVGRIERYAACFALGYFPSLASRRRGSQVLSRHSTCIVGC